jgi:glycosyltransferase involved in cell wall biosynthesis
MRKVLIVTNIPTPYRVPLFNELAVQLGAAGYALRVAFAAAGYQRRQWRVDLAEYRFEHEFLHSRAFTLAGGESASFTYPGLFALLHRHAPDVTVITGFSLGTVKLWLRNRMRTTPYLIWSGAIGGAETGAAWRRVQRRALVRDAVGYIAYGSAAQRYLESLGAPPAMIHVARNTVETEFFRAETAKLRGPAKGQATGQATGQEILAIGDLTERKANDLLLPAFALAARERPAARLTLVGDGPQRSRLEAQARQLGIAGQVQFAGFRQRAEVPAFLARARCLALPTRFDIWGLVLPEAMAAGVPCVASIHAGATEDLIEEGVTGLRADFADTPTAAERLAWMLDHPAEARRMGEAAAELIRDKASLAVSAAGFVAGIRAADERARRS